MNSSRRGKKAVFGQGRPEEPKDTARMFLWRQVPPLMTFCGQWKTTWQYLTEISHAGMDNCTLLYPPNMKRSCARMDGTVYCVRIDFDLENMAVLN